MVDFDPSTGKICVLGKRVSKTRAEMLLNGLEASLEVAEKYSTEFEDRDVATNERFVRLYHF